MNTPTISQAGCETVPPGAAIVPRYRIATSSIAIFFTIQLADILLMIWAYGRGYFRHGAGPIANAVGLSELGVWVLMKASAFVVLFAAVITGRRFLIVFLNCWFGALLIWMTVMLTTV